MDSVSPYSAGPLRDFLLPLGALLLSVYLPFMTIVSLFVVTGQAHFITGYRYQLKGKKTNRTYFFVAGALLFLAIGYSMLHVGIIPLLLLIGVLFSAHFAYDEITLHGEMHTKSSLITVGGFTLYFSLLVATYVFPSLLMYAPYTLVVPFAAAILRFGTDRSLPSRGEQYLWISELVIFVVGFVSGNPGSVLAVIVLLHVANWYVGYGGRVSGDTPRARAYWTEVSITLAVLAALFYVYVFTRTPVLAVLFAAQSYYMWAIAHIVLSFVASRTRNISTPVAI